MLYISPMKKYFDRISKQQSCPIGSFPDFQLDHIQKIIKNALIKTSMGKIIAGKTSEIPPGKMIKVSIDGRDILVANIDGEYHATDDSCTHSGSSLSERKTRRLHHYLRMAWGRI